MLALTISLKDRCRQTLLRCDKFQSYEQLMTVFSVVELLPYQQHLPHAGSQSELVDSTIAFLEKYNTPAGHPVFPIFLRSLLISIPEETDLHDEVDRLALDIEYEFLLQHTKHNKVVNDGYRFGPEAPVTLARHFYMCSCMQKRKQRIQVLSQLFSEISYQSEYNENIPEFTVICQIIQQHIDQPKLLARLANTLYTFEGNSPQWQALNKMFCNIYHTIVSYPSILQLQSLLAKAPLPDKVLKAAYLNSIPDGWESLPLSDSSELLLPVLEDLSRIPLQTDGSLPLFVFLEYLALYILKIPKRDVAQKVRNWVKEQAAELAIKPQQLADMRTRAQQSSASTTPPYLLITLEPVDQDTCTAQAWLFDTSPRPLLAAGQDMSDTPIALANMPLLLNKWLAGCGQYLGDRLIDLVVECFLPHELLSYPVERWTVETGMIDVELGKQHQVVVRSLKRVQIIASTPSTVGKPYYLWSSWKQKWKECEKCLSGQQSSSQNQELAQIWTEEKGQEDPQRLYDDLHGSATACLALTFVPSSKAFNAIFSAGIPILFWPRKNVSEPEPVQSFFTQALSCCTLARLPSLLWEKRKEANGDHHYGRHLTLLWDDPSRLPPTYTAPVLIPPLTSVGEAP